VLFNCHVFESFPNVYHIINVGIRTFHDPSGPMWPWRYMRFYGLAVGTGNVIVLGNQNSGVATF